MKRIPFLRVADVLANAQPESQQALRRNFGGGKIDDADLRILLGDPEHIARRASSLSEEARARLLFVRATGFAPYDTAGPNGKVDTDLIELGLLAVHSDETISEVVVPVEVNVALFDHSNELESPLVAWLGQLENDELRELAVRHGIELRGHDDDIEIAAELAAAILDTDRLEHLLESLEADSRDLLLWLVDLPAARRFANSAFPGRKPNTPAPDRVLLRLGLLFVSDVEANRVVVPIDLAEILFEVRDLALSNRAFASFEDLRATGSPAFVDQWPRGAGGNPLVTMRYRLLRAMRFGLDPDSAADRVLALLRIWDVENNDVGANASFHLDVASPEAFARLAIRNWLMSIDDDATRWIVGAFGGDSARIADHLFATTRDPGVGSAPEADEPETNWANFVYDLRAHLFLALSVMQPGHWISLDALAAWYVDVYNRLVWLHGRHWMYPAEFPIDALPRHPSTFAQPPDAEVQEALRMVCELLLVPIGAVHINAAGTHLLTNVHAMRVNRGDDPEFDDLWFDAQGYLADDIDLWQPLPTDAGVRVCGLAELRWVGDHSISIPLDAHCCDLIELGAFADVAHDGDAFLFTFNTQSVQRGLSREADDERFLVWLASRTGRTLPVAIRTLFGRRGTQAIGRPAELARIAAKWVDETIGELARFGAWPPRSLLEELRAWGTVGADRITHAVGEIVNRRRWNAPELPVLCVVLGEIGDDRALPVLLRCVGFSDEPSVEAAAAMAIARIGPRASDGLSALVTNEGAEFDKRLAAAGALSAMAVLHPETCGWVVEVIARLYDQGEPEPDIATIAALYIADTGHPRFDEDANRLMEQGLWDNTISYFDEAVNISRNAPSVWGHPVWALPITQIFPPDDEFDFGEPPPDAADDETPPEAHGANDSLEDSLRSRSRRGRRDS
jgi:hypothetical protein